MLQQGLDEVTFLKGATVEDVKVHNDGDEYGFDAIEIKFALKKPTKLGGFGPNGTDEMLCRKVSFQVWEDPEGNGPGFLSLCGGEA